MSVERSIAIQLASTRELIEELAGRASSLVLMAQFPVQAGQSAELARWRGNDAHKLLGLCRDLEGRILLELRQEQLRLSTREAIEETGLGDGDEGPHDR